MKLFSFIRFTSRPQPSRATPLGVTDLQFDPELGANGNLVLRASDGTSRPFGGNARSGTPVTGRKATYTLTSNGTTPANNSTVTIAGRVYTFKTTITSAPGDVLIEGTAALALANLKLAINRAAGSPGGKYSVATIAHPTVVATTSSATVQTIEAINSGAAVITTAKSSVTHTWAPVITGLSGTKASRGDMLFDATNLYFASTDMTSSSTVGWRKIAHTAL